MEKKNMKKEYTYIHICVCITDHFVFLAKFINELYFNNIFKSKKKKSN